MSRLYDHAIPHLETDPLLVRQRLYKVEHLRVTVSQIKSWSNRITIDQYFIIQSHYLKTMVCVKIVSLLWFVTQISQQQGVQSSQFGAQPGRFCEQHYKTNQFIEKYNSVLCDRKSARHIGVEQQVKYEVDNRHTEYNRDSQNWTPKKIVSSKIFHDLGQQTECRRTK